MGPLERYRKRAEEDIARVLRSWGVEIDVCVEEARPGFGDLTFRCFPLARALRDRPDSIAYRLCEELRPEGFERVEAVGGYVNFHLNRRAFTSDVLREALNGTLFYFPPRGKRVIVEHTSANPTGPLHVGRGRNPILGDTIARMLRAVGYDVVTHYYVNDMGKQAAVLMWGVERYGVEASGKWDHVYVEAYQRAYEGYDEDEVADLLRKYEEGDEEVSRKVKTVLSRVLEGIGETLASINVRVDRYVWESDVVRSEYMRRAMEVLGKLAEVDNGALYVSLDKLGIRSEKDRIYITRSDGTTLYPARDVAYHLMKSDEGDVLIDVLGEDHKLHGAFIKAVVEGATDVIVEPVFYSFVRLPEGRMSTRRGAVVYLDDLIEEAVERAAEEVRKRRGDMDPDELMEIARKVGISAVRYNVLKVQNEKPMVFRWEEALNFEGDSAPYVQYTYARASSILRNYEGEISTEPPSKVHPSEWTLVKAMASYRSVVEAAAEKRSPHLVARYARDMADAFNAFYRDCPVLQAGGPARAYRVAIVTAYRKTMERIFDIIGVEKTEKM